MFGGIAIIGGLAIDANARMVTSETRSIVLETSDGCADEGADDRKKVAAAFAMAIASVLIASGVFFLALVFFPMRDLPDWLMVPAGISFYRGGRAITKAIATTSSQIDPHENSAMGETFGADSSSSRQAPNVEGFANVGLAFTLIGILLCTLGTTGTLTRQHYIRQIVYCSSQSERPLPKTCS